MNENHSAVVPPCGTITGLDKPVSRLFFGTAIPQVIAGRNADRLFDTAFDLGINAFDCARGYGKAEHVLGQWIRARKNREQIVLLTKCGNVDLFGRVRVNRGVILKELEKSLLTLGVDDVDLYLLHRDDPDTPAAELIETLNECKKAGKKGTTVSDIALRYNFSSGMDVYAIVSSSNAQRLAQNAESACHPLTPDEAAFLEQDEA